MPRQLLLGTRKGLFTATQKGRSWRLDEPAFRGVPVSMVLHDPRDGALYAALDHGHFGCKLQRRDGGRWREVAAPAYPQLGKGKKQEKDKFGRDWPRTLKLIWSLELDPRQQGALWCGTIPGGLFHSDDRGASWRFDDSLWNERARRSWVGGGYDLPGIHSVVVDPRDPERVTIGVSVGGVWRTDDGGRKWRNTSHGMRAEYMPKEQAYDVDAQDPHRLSICAAAPDRVWCQHHNGIFVTKRDGVSWKESRAKAPSRFGFACVAHPGDKDTAWFAPAQKDECRVPVDGKVCVLRTSDGGRSFDVLRKGLPQQHAYDLVFRHGMDVTPDGETLAMASTTGNVWIGEGGGDSWTQLPASLPPVFCVRWV